MILGADAKEKIWYVYVDCRLDTDSPFYVGKGNEQRLSKKERNLYHTNICNKHGFRRDIIFETHDEDLALNVEIEMIKELKTRDCFGGANFTDGGDGVSGLISTKQSIEKNRIAHTGLVQSEEACIKKSVSMFSSHKVKRKRINQLTLSGDIVMTHESVSAAARSIGKPDSATLISRCCQGKVQTFNKHKWVYADVLSSKVSIVRLPSQIKKVEQVNIITGEIIVHDSINAAARSINKNNVSIRMCCHNKRVTAYGFKWKFVD